MSGNNKMPNFDGYRPILRALLGMVMVATILVGGIVISGRTLDAASTPLVTTVLGFTSISVLALINMLNGVKVHATGKRTEEKVDMVLNGPMDDKMRTAVRQVLAEREYALDKAAGLNPALPKHLKTRDSVTKP